MAEYIDRETLIEFVKKYSANINGETTLKCVEIAIRNAPTEDVVPRSEVEELKKIYRTYNKAIKYERQELAKQIFEEIDNLLERHQVNTFSGIYYIKEDYTELKKKYIGEKGE